MLKTIRTTGSAANLEETKSKVGGNNVVSNSIVSSGEATKLTKRKN